MTDPTPESGRELDAKVAEEVFGWKRTTWEAGNRVAFGLGGFGELPREFTFLADPKRSPVEHYRSEQVEEVGELVALDLPHYSTDIAAAWEVVEKMKETRCDFQMERTPAGWFAGFPIPTSEAETAPLAICRCALKAVRADTEGADRE